MTTLNDFTANGLNGKPQNLSVYAGKVVIVVNTASLCGYTPQYKGLQALYEKYKDQGLVILGFPCNQFGKQEPGDAAAIGSFCEARFAVTFPLFEKIKVNGTNAHPLYQWLKTEKRGVLGTANIKWNFTKFLIGRDGLPIKRFATITKPEAMISAIEAALAK